MNRNLKVACLAAAIAASACSSDSEKVNPTDMSTNDTNLSDTGADTNTVDVNTGDAGIDATNDTGSTDTGTGTDTGNTDTGTTDTGDDTGVSDMGDTGATDMAGDAGDAGMDMADMDVDMGPTGTGNAFLYGDPVVNNTYAVGAYDAMADAVTFPVFQGLEDGEDINGVAVSPDGATIVISGHNAMSSSDFLYAYDLANLGAPTVLVDTNTVGHSITIEAITFSPDGANIAFLADIDLDNAVALHVVSAAGGTLPIRASQIPVTGGDVRDYVWVNNTTLAYDGDVVTDDINGLWSVDISAAMPTPLALIDPMLLATNQEVSISVPLDVDNQGRIYFTSDHEVDNLFRLMRVNADGTTLQQVPGTAVVVGTAEASISAFGVSPDGGSLAFVTSPEQGMDGQVQLLDLTATMPVQVTNFASTLAPTQTATASVGRVVWSPDQQILLVLGDWPLSSADLDNEFALFAIQLSNQSVVRIVDPQVTNSDVQAAFFSTDQSRLFIVGDLVVNNNSEFHVTTDFTTADQDPATLRRVTVPDSGDIFGAIPVNN